MAAGAARRACPAEWPKKSGCRAGGGPPGIVATALGERAGDLARDPPEQRANDDRQRHGGEDAGAEVEAERGGIRLEQAEGGGAGIAVDAGGNGREQRQVGTEDQDDHGYADHRGDAEQAAGTAKRADHRERDGAHDGAPQHRRQRRLGAGLAAAAVEVARPGDEDDPDLQAEHGQRPEYQPRRDAAHHADDDRQCRHEIHVVPPDDRAAWIGRPDTARLSRTLAAAGRWDRRGDVRHRPGIGARQPCDESMDSVFPKVIVVETSLCDDNSVKSQVYRHQCAYYYFGPAANILLLESRARSAAQGQRPGQRAGRWPIAATCSDGTIPPAAVLR